MNTTLGHKSCYKLVIHSLNLFAFFQWHLLANFTDIPVLLCLLNTKKSWVFFYHRQSWNILQQTKEFLLQLKPYKVATTHQQITMALTFYSKHHTDLKHHDSYIACVRTTQLLWVQSKFMISIKTSFHNPPEMSCEHINKGHGLLSW
jgi:hypothetical protein